MGTDSGERSGGGRHLDDTMPAQPPAMEPPGVPTGTADRYRLGVELGRGGMGRVVEAFDVQLGRSVAVKEALPRGGQGTYRRFAREVHITARLEHASIVPLYDSGTTVDGRPFYVMRRVSGRPLDELLGRARGLGERLALLPALLAAMDAIAHAHKRGIIHRDLKPGNILVGELGETVVIDWGLAKVIGEEDESMESLEPRPSDSLQTQAGSVFGTPGFMAPEQARGEELGPRGDVYALGACLYQLLAGSPPFAGSTSATEVIDRTRKNQIRPLSEAAPGAPRELVAIVEKALSFDPQQRYANAAQLGEDVRRFTQGQLVAAHRYTRRQRVARFAKRNRLPLVIAALSTAAIAVLSWINVHRIMVERQMAVDQQVMTQRHADELLVQNASNYVDSDPTHALAILKKLDPSSDKIADARSIAEAAVARGVAWGIDTNDDDVLPPDFSPDGRRLALTTFSGLLQIYDVDSHALVRSKQLGRGARGIWVDGGKRLLVWGGPTPAYFLDPNSGQTTPVAADTLKWAQATPAGDRVMYEADGKSVGLLDVATATVKTLWTGKGSPTISSDANWFIVQEEQTVSLYDHTGKVVSTLVVGDAGVAWLVAGRGGKLAITTGLTVYEYDIPTSTWTQRSVDLGSKSFVLSVLYRGDELSAFTTDGFMLGWRGDRWIERLRADSITAAPVEVGDSVVVLPSANHIYWASTTAHGAINLPHFTGSRVGARAGLSKIALAGRGAVLVYDLSSVVPRHLPVQASGAMFTFMDDDTLLLWTNGEPWHMFDLKTNEMTEIPIKWIGAVSKLDRRPSEKRVLLVFAEIRSHLLEIRTDPKPLRHLASGPGLPDRGEAMMVGKLIPGDATMFADNDNRLYATFADAHPNEITQLDGTVRSICALGRLRYAAISDNGEVVRGSLDDGKIERTRVPARDDLMVESDLDGHLLIGAGKELLQWDSDVQVIKKFDRPIIGLAPMAGGVLVVLADHSIVGFELATRQIVDVAPRNTQAFDTTDDGKLFAGLLDGGNMRITSMPAGVSWELPVGSFTMSGISMAPHAHRVVVGNSTLSMWELPTSDDDLIGWINKQTNAEEQGRSLVWPWQLNP